MHPGVLSAWARNRRGKMDAPRYRVVVEVNANDVGTLGSELIKLGTSLVDNPTDTEYVDDQGDVNYELHVYDMKEAPGL